MPFVPSCDHPELALGLKCFTTDEDSLVPGFVLFGFGEVEAEHCDVEHSVGVIGEVEREVES
jgi:hypothetical protein